MTKTPDRQRAPRICFVGMKNLPVLAREYGQHGVGGAELQQTLLARALVRCGLQVCMIVADYGQPEGATWEGVKTYKAYRADAGIPVVRFVVPRWTKLWSALKRADADIYYTSCAGAQVGQIALFARRRGARFIFRVASNADCDPQGLLIRFWRDRVLYRYGLQRADLVLAQTPEQQRALDANFGRTSRVVASLTERAAPSAAFADRHLGVLWVGNFRSLKRPEWLLEIARRLPHIPFQMIGGPMPGAQALFTAVREQAAGIPNVHFHGPVPYHDVGQFYSRARILVGTSAVEGFPNTYLQAWAHGTPVVAFLDPDQLLARHGMGRAVRDLDEMCAAISTLSCDASRWELASRRALQYMDSRFNEAQMLAPYSQAIQDVLQNKPQGGARTQPARESLLKS